MVAKDNLRPRHHNKCIVKQAIDKNCEEFRNTVKVCGNVEEKGEGITLEGYNCVVKRVIQLQLVVLKFTFCCVLTPGAIRYFKSIMNLLFKLGGGVFENVIWER